MITDMLDADDDLDDRRGLERPYDPVRRAQPRRRCLLAGLLAEPYGESWESVSIRNLSPVGAKLDLGGMRPVSSGLVLLVPRLNMAWELDVVWRRLPSVGVRFTRPYDLADDPALQAMMRRAAA